MRTASLKPEVAVMDNEDLEEVSGDDDWQFVSLGEQQNFGIRTAGMIFMVRFDHGLEIHRELREVEVACDFLCLHRRLQFTFHGPAGKGKNPRHELTILG